MKWNSLALSLMVAGAVVAFPSMGMSQTTRENAEARRLFNEGVEFQDRGRLVEAERKFREALTRYPKADQSDKTAYYLIDALMKLRKLQDARTEINQFLRNYPLSKWNEYVTEFIWELGGQVGTPAGGAIWNSPEEVRAAQFQADLLRGAFTPDGPPEKIYPENFSPSAGRNAVILRQIIQMDPERGIESAKDLLKADPSDPAVVANLGTIANTNSPHRVPFLLGIWTNPAASPNVRKQAFFWFGRRNPDKEAVAKAIMDLLESKETEVVASEALSLMIVADHRAVLEKVVSSSRPNKFDLMRKIYQRGSVLLRTDLLMFISRLEDSRAVAFLLEAAQNDSDSSVRRAAAQALAGRRDVDINLYQRILKSPQPTTRTQQPLRLLPPTSSGSGSNFLPSLANSH